MNQDQKNICLMKVRELATVGVDYFPEGETFEMETTQGVISGVSRGASYHKSDVDPEDT